ncbi:MAG: hypothetical protein HY399_03850 [Elusimicrobia bacterium]|nr:hypothetical protein [Elusimicrobiota bacterium]
MLFFLILLAVMQLSPVLFSSRIYFWGDLTYLQHPWRTLCAESLTRGEVPHWNPYAYLGMPLLANFQTGLFYPGSLLFYFLPYPYAFKAYLLVQYVLMGFFALLWFRAWGFVRSASLMGAVAFLLGGIAVSRVLFLNELATLVFLPAFFLFGRTPFLLAMVVALSFFGGYPVAFGCIVGAFLFLWGAGGSRRFFSSPGEILLGLGGGILMAGCLLLPGLELIAQSERILGLGLDVSTAHAFSPRDFGEWLAPWLREHSPFKPALFWWKSCYVGVVGVAAAVWGFWRSSFRTRILLGGYLLFLGLLLCGAETPISLWFWKNMVFLRWIRHPGHLTNALLPVLLLLIVAGAQQMKKAWWAFLALELLVYGFRAHPTIHQDYYYDRGPLVEQLQRSLGPHRYLLSGMALDWTKGEGVGREAAYRDLKHRLYGLENLPYHLEAVGNFGEPLVPRNNARWIDLLYKQPGLKEVHPYLPYTDVRLVLTRDPVPPDGLEERGKNLWELYRTPAPLARAYHVAENRERGEFPVLGKGLDVEQFRSDRFLVSGQSFHNQEIWVAQAAYPGWRAFMGGQEILFKTAQGLFPNFVVPAGTFDVTFRYFSSLWPWGVLLTLLTTLGLGVYWYNRWISVSHLHETG